MLVVLDTNVLLALATEDDDVADAMALVRRRLRAAQLLMPPTVQEELAAEVMRADDFADRERAQLAFEIAREWDIHLHRLTQTQRQLVRRVGQRLRRAGLLPEAEVNDGLIVAEAALLGATLLLTGDEHLRGIDFQRLTYELRTFDLTPSVIATPREVVRKFFR